MGRDSTARRLTALPGQTSDLDQLGEDAGAGFRVEEGDPPAVEADPGSAVDETDAGGVEAVEGGGDVGDSVGGMVHPVTAFGEEAGDGTIAIQRRDQLDIARRRVEGGDGDSLFLDDLPPSRREPERGVPGDGRVQVGDDDPDMMDFHPEVSQDSARWGGVGSGRHGDVALLCCERQDGARTAVDGPGGFCVAPQTRAFGLITIAGCVGGFPGLEPGQ